MIFKNTIKTYKQFIQESKLSFDDLHKLSEKQKSDISKIFCGEFEIARKEGIFFYGCSFKTYISFYKRRLDKYLSNFEDVKEIDFLLLEIESYEQSFENLAYSSPSNDKEKVIVYKCIPLLNSDTEINFNSSNSKIKEWLYNKGEQLGYDIFFDQDMSPSLICHKNPNNYNRQISNLRWKGDKNDLIELVEALYTSKTVDGKKTDMYKVFGQIFNIEIKNPSQSVTKMKSRKNSETLFLDKLKEALTESFQR